MKISCEIIKDLLPLYHDGVCSSESRAMVEEHLSGCANCKEDLAAMDAEFSIDSIEHNLDEAEAVKTLSKKWKKGMMKSLLKGVLYTLIGIAGIFVIACILYVFIGINITVV